MIVNKSMLKEYLEKDKRALGYTRKFPRFYADDLWRFEIYLRKYEYYLNTGKNKFALMYYKIKHHRLGMKLGYTVPANVFGAGLRINHYGYLVVNSKAKIGEFCDIHQGVNIGESIDGEAPILGDNVWIGPGVKIFGGITVGDNVMIGANAVVNKSFPDGNQVIAGVPAKEISKGGEKNTDTDEVQA